MKLTQENYHSEEANRFYMSNSQYKGFMSCEAQEVAKLNGLWLQDTTDAMMQGKYVHAWNEGTLDKFRTENHSMFKKDGSLYATYEICNTVIECIKKDVLFMKALSGKKEVIFTAEMFGAPWKILIDSYFEAEKRLGDLKVLKALDDKFWNKELQIYENVFEYRGYFTQMAVYSEIERRANKREDYFEPFLAVVTKEKYPDKAVISFVSNEETAEQFITRELAAIEANMPRIIRLKTGKEAPVRCERCDYCKSTKKLSGTAHYTSFNLY